MKGRRAVLATAISLSRKVTGIDGGGGGPGTRMEFTPAGVQVLSALSG
jgi:hypothetical protein